MLWLGCRAFKQQATCFIKLGPTHCVLVRVFMLQYFQIQLLQSDETSQIPTTYSAVPLVQAPMQLVH